LRVNSTTFMAARLKGFTVQGISGVRLIFSTVFGRCGDSSDAVFRCQYCSNLFHWPYAGNSGLARCRSWRCGGGRLTEQPWRAASWRRTVGGAAGKWTATDLRNNSHADTYKHNISLCSAIYVRWQRGIARIRSVYFTRRAHSSKPAARCCSGRTKQTDKHMDGQTEGHRAIT